MGIFDQIKDLANQHSDKVEQGIDQAGDFVDSKTEGKYADHVDRAQDFLKDRVGPADEPENTEPAQ